MENIQSTMKELFGNSCLAYCYAKLANWSSDTKQLTRAVLNGWYEDYIDDDGFVLSPVAYWNNLSPNKIKNVVKVPITKLSELPKGAWVVEYKLTPSAKDSHFVIATSEAVIFDPSGYSNTVAKGTPVSYRRLIYV